MTQFSSPSSFANKIQDLEFREGYLAGYGTGTAATTVAAGIVPISGRIASFRARVIDAGTTGTRNVVSLVRLPAGVSTEIVMHTLAVPSGTDGNISGLPPGATNVVAPGDILRLKADGITTGAAVAYAAVEIVES